MDEVVLYTILGISVFGNLIAWVFIGNLLNQTKQLEKAVEDSLSANDKIQEDVEKYYRVLYGIFTSAAIELDRVDKKGSFSSDDEVGFAFKAIQETIMDVKEKMDYIKRDDRRAE